MSAREWCMAKLEAFSTAEVSSRSLGIIRIFAALIILHEFSGFVTFHRVDEHLLIIDDR